jgi:hypothetical protein
MKKLWSLLLLAAFVMFLSVGNLSVTTNSGCGQVPKLIQEVQAKSFGGSSGGYSGSSGSRSGSSFGGSSGGYKSSPNTSFGGSKGSLSTPSQSKLFGGQKGEMAKPADPKASSPSQKQGSIGGNNYNTSPGQSYSTPWWHYVAFWYLFTHSGDGGGCSKTSESERSARGKS